MRADESGSTTAEAAVVLPTLVLFTVAMTWLVSLGVAQVRAVDAARETARSIARGDDSGQGVSLGRRVALPGSRIAVDSGGRQIVVRVVSPVRGPGGAFDFLPRVQVHAEAVAVHEPGTDGAS